MLSTLVLIRQRLAALRAAVDELADLAAAAELSEAAGATLLPLQSQARLLLDLDRMSEDLEKIAEEISGAIDPRQVQPDSSEATPADRTTDHAN
jgi:hypothetical protein